MTLSIAILLAIAAAPVAPARNPAGTPEITVYAAASLKDILTSIAPICAEKARVRFVHNFGASNDLARQIVAANKADIFLSADEAWMDHVADAGLVLAGTRRTLLSNRLAVVVPQDSALAPRAAEDLASDSYRRLALANPGAVPAGRYAKQWLEAAGMWERVAAKVVPAPDVRAALAMVESGAADAGIVYRTDAAIARRVRVAFVASAGQSPRISYPIAALAERPHAAAARRAIDCYAAPEARSLFENAGFVVFDPPAAR